MYGLGFFSFNIVGLSSPLLPCRLVDLRRGLLYSENLQHPPLLSSHSTAPFTDYTSGPIHLPIAWSAHLGQHLRLCHSHFVIERKLRLVSWSLLGLQCLV